MWPPVTMVDLFFFRDWNAVCHENIISREIAKKAMSE